MARHLERVILLSSTGTHVRYLSTRAAYRMVEDGSAEEMDDNAATGMLVFQLRSRRAPDPDSSYVPLKVRVVATLTKSDMERNADAVIRNRRNRSRDKVDAWPGVHDTFAVTVVDGRVFIPDPQAAAKRVKQMRRKSRHA